MNLLLDTHVILWWLTGDRRLRPAARASIAEGARHVAVSAASAWEIAIKAAAGRIDPPSEWLDVALTSGFEPLSMTVAHALEAGSLPRHHADPFDRMLVAQARIEHLVIVTADPRLSLYEVQTLDA